MEKYFEGIANCIIRDSQEEPFQENIFHYLFLNKELKYNKKDVEARRNFGGYIPDLTISIAEFTCFIEIKRYKKKYNQNFNDGLNQLASYLKVKRVEYGILTDSETWYFIKVHPTLRSYQLIYSHKISGDDSQSRNFLMQLSKGRIQKMFGFADAVFGLKGFKWAVTKSLWTDKLVFDSQIKDLFPAVSKSQLSMLKRDIKWMLLIKTEKRPDNKYVKIR